MVVQTPSAGELVIYGEGTMIGSEFVSAAMAREYIQNGCVGYVAYVVNS